MMALIFLSVRFNGALLGFVDIGDSLHQDWVFHDRAIALVEVVPGSEHRLICAAIRIQGTDRIQVMSDHLLQGVVSSRMTVGSDQGYVA